MTRFLIGTMPFVGHVTPLLPIARALVERGHEVRWYAGGRYRPKVEATGARFMPMTAAPDFDDGRLEARFPERAPRGQLAKLKFDLEHVFADSAVGQFKDYQAILREFPADVLLSDAGFLGARWVHEKGGPPWATLNPLPVTLSSRDTAPFGLGIPPSSSGPGRLRNRLLRTLFTRVLFRDTIRYVDRLRVGLGLHPTGEFVMDAALSPYLYLQGTVAGFEYPRGDLAPQVHFIGSTPPSRPADFSPPDWWPELRSGRRVVHVTQGTVATEASHLLAPTIRALAGEDVLVVATTGGKPVESLGLRSLPANARVETFIPHAHLLPHVDVMVTNGGYNGVQVALANGVPLVAAGTSEDKPEVCQRVAWAGVGINLKTARPREQQLRRAVRTVLTTRRYRERAQAMQAEFARHDAPAGAVVLLEQLAATGQPVLARR